MADNENKTGIVLCGGGVRGLAQIGVLAALEDNGISPHFISGASIGAVIGAFYAKGYAPEEMLKISRQSSLIKVFRLGINKKGLSNLKYLQHLLEKHIKIDSFDALKKPLFVCASNLNTGKFEIFEKGELFRPVMASAAVPILFQPQEINGYIYVDGGLLNNFPIEPLIDKCEKKIGVFVHNHEQLSKIETWGSIIDRCVSLHIYENSRDRIKKCDVLIKPEEAFNFNVFRKKTDEELYRIGYEATEKQIDEINKTLHS